MTVVKKVNLQASKKKGKQSGIQYNKQNVFSSSAKSFLLIGKVAEWTM